MGMFSGGYYRIVSCVFVMEILLLVRLFIFVFWI